MKKNVEFIFVCLFVSILSACNTIPISKGKQGLVPYNTTCFVINTLLDEDDLDYETEEMCDGWIAVSPERYEQLQNEWNDLASRYLKCKANPKQCK